jgi:acetyl-CoA carboxylase carboxyltransferase component
LVREALDAARKAARKAARETSKPAKSTERRQRAQQFLREQLARGPKPASFVEDAAEKAHVETRALEQARVDLGVVTSRSNAGGVQAVQWSLPG